MHVLLIHNPGSGGEDHDRDALVRALARVGHDIDYRSTEDDEWIDALSAKPDLFAVAGGDGTVNKVLKELAASSTPVTVIPLGTANNIAGTLGLTGASAEELIAAWPDFVLRPFDIGEASAPWGTRQFVETAGGGLLAELFQSAEEQDEPDDKVRHGLELLRDALAAVRPARWQLELDGADLSGELLGVETMNIREVVRSSRSHRRRIPATGCSTSSRSPTSIVTRCAHTSRRGSAARTLGYRSCPYTAATS